ncbi:hypothetical protein GNI_105360 [Gregarina niphandrodes]|uniref:Uncharacterized protein n=1 Tax=Gregarina niphandrodes TaxID=110365 RepID=A0A023B429_GRENI|nr:hypothetical protein GNI_105360 [Gregarina niphandrodes]EZG56145.1 hypothetical protein GNI_105360 [Gregarina niphandrodes]|eukprot:XP_011131318.1 hypothetical protein GNI_105360 [Gregarina niphandrodes]
MSTVGLPRECMTIKTFLCCRSYLLARVCLQGVSYIVYCYCQFVTKTWTVFYALGCGCVLAFLDVICLSKCLKNRSNGHEVDATPSISILEAILGDRAHPLAHHQVVDQTSEATEDSPTDRQSSEADLSGSGSEPEPPDSDLSGSDSSGLESSGSAVESTGTDDGYPVGYPTGRGNEEAQCSSVGGPGFESGAVVQGSVVVEDSLGSRNTTMKRTGATGDIAASIGDFGPNTVGCNTVGCNTVGCNTVGCNTADCFQRSDRMASSMIEETGIDNDVSPRIYCSRQVRAMSRGTGTHRGSTIVDGCDTFQDDGCEIGEVPCLAESNLGRGPRRLGKRLLTRSHSFVLESGSQCAARLLSNYCYLRTSLAAGAAARRRQIPRHLRKIVPLHRLGLFLDRLDEVRPMSHPLIVTINAESFRILKLAFLTTLWSNERYIMCCLSAILVGMLLFQNTLFKIVQFKELRSKSISPPSPHAWNIHSWNYYLLRWRLWWKDKHAFAKLMRKEQNGIIYRGYALACLAFDSPLLFHHIKEHYATPYDHEKLEFALSIEFVT